MLEVGAGLSLAPDTRKAAMEADMAARDGGGGSAPTLAVVFASPHHAEEAEAVVDAIHEAASPAALIGCVGESVLGGGREIEADPAVSVWLARFPGEVQTYTVSFVPTEDGGGFTGWPGGDPGERHVLIADPFTMPADVLLEEVERDQPGTVVIGGMASGGARPGETRLFLNHDVLTEGAVGVRLPDGVHVRTLVSQGCRPVGSAFTVTRADGNVILELGGQAPMERIREIYATLDENDRALVSGGLHIGRVIDEYKTQPDRGDFLIRGVIGADPESGAIAVGDRIQVGETVRFHVRDAHSADEDLRDLLAAAEDRPAGVLLFTCNGRGSRMFPTPDHDASVVSDALGKPPVAGFFCAGELGPVGPGNFLHGYTASLALFYEG